VLLTSEAVPKDFETVRCFGHVCVARRSGACAPIPPRPLFGAIPGSADHKSD
jgi:hypothetical protein